MNQGRIWTVVQPTIGLPLFLGAVALTSVGVHAAVLGNTPWMKDYWTGAAKPKVAKAEAASPTSLAQAGASFDVRVAKAPGADGAVTVTLVPQTAPTAGAAVHNDRLAVNTVRSR